MFTHHQHTTAQLPRHSQTINERTHDISMCHVIVHHHGWQRHFGDTVVASLFVAPPWYVRIYGSITHNQVCLDLVYMYTSLNTYILPSVIVNHMSVSVTPRGGVTVDIGDSNLRVMSQLPICMHSYMHIHCPTPPIMHASNVEHSHHNHLVRTHSLSYAFVATPHLHGDTVYVWVVLVANYPQYIFPHSISYSRPLLVTMYMYLYICMSVCRAHLAWCHRHHPDPPMSPQSWYPAPWVLYLIHPCPLTAFTSQGMYGKACIYISLYIYLSLYLYLRIVCITISLSSFVAIYIYRCHYLYTCAIYAYSNMTSYCIMFLSRVSCSSLAHRHLVWYLYLI